MRVISVLVGLLGFTLLSGQPLHDACNQAHPLTIGETLIKEDNRFASIDEKELPEIAPATCIRTFENDLWYEFTTEAPYQYYSITVDPLSCETPAGLQLLLIKADTCDPGSFSYTACLNPYKTEPLELFWENPFPGEHYFVHVDGYDGNICQFRLTLQGHNEDPRTLKDLRRLRYDPGHPDPTFLEAGLSSRFENNEVVLSWQANSREEISFFLIERVWVNRYDSSLTGTVVDRVEPSNTVGSNLMTNYQHVINRRFPDEQELCYQVVKVTGELQVDYSPVTCVTTDIIKDFFISDVFVYEDGPPGTYAVKYINSRKQDLEFNLYNEKGKFLKGYVRKREPLTDGVITVDMSDYPPGRYRLDVKGRKGTYRRLFFVE